MKQPREVQFLIERLCPHQMPDLIARYPQLRSIPFPLLVLADEQFNLSHPCSAKRVYKIDPKRAEQIRRAYGLPLSHVDRFVCEHMGRIIE